MFLISVIAANNVDSFVVATYAATMRIARLVQTGNVISPDFARDFKPMNTLEIVVSDVVWISAANDENIFIIQSD